MKLVGILSALGALGGLASGGASVAKTIVTNAKNAVAQLEENNRHNQKIALGKGLYLRPHRRGYDIATALSRYQTKKF